MATTEGIVGLCSFVCFFQLIGSMFWISSCKTSKSYTEIALRSLELLVVLLLCDTHRRLEKDCSAFLWKEECRPSISGHAWNEWIENVVFNLIIWYESKAKTYEDNAYLTHLWNKRAEPQYPDTINPRKVHEIYINTDICHI